MAPPRLSLSGVTARYGSVGVLHGVNLELQPGELLLLAGPNGAGKSTLMKTLIGVHRQWGGEILLDGRSVTHLGPHSRARLGMAWIPEGRGVIPQLTVEENLALARFSPRWRAEHRDRSFQRFPVLAGARRRAAGTLSGGEQQMLALARALESAPQVLLIDEPSLGLAPKVVDQVMETLLDLSNDGQSILLVEQRAAQVQHVASRILLMRQGVLEPAPEDIEFTEMDFADFSSADLSNFTIGDRLG